jgi:hypothetical protein
MQGMIRRTILYLRDEVAAAPYRWNKTALGYAKEA